MPPRRAVYTALLGRYEELNEQPTALDTDIPFICFTDDPNLVSETWQIHLVDPLFPLDMVRSQRDIKIRGHETLTQFDETLYIDNSVSLKQVPDIVLDEWLASTDLAVSLHSFRDRIVDEFDEVIAQSLDDPSRVHEQLMYYAHLYPEVLYERPFWNGILARRHTEAVNKAMQLWFDHVLRFSRRDQLSANVAFSLAGIQVRGIEHDNWESTMHRWPVDLSRKVQLRKAPTRKAGPLLAEVARLELDVARGSAEVARLELDVARGSAEVARLELDVARGSAEVARLELDLTRVSLEAADCQDKVREVEALSQELQQSNLRAQQSLREATHHMERVEATLSWRVTKPLRSIRRGLKRIKAGVTQH
jgi:Protein of unknown function (DUF616)